MKILSAIGSWIGLNRSYLTLLLVAAAAAYAWVQWSTLEKDRDQLLAFSRQICAAAGADYEVRQARIRTGDGKSKTVKVDRGELCRRRVAQLAAFERDTNAETARILAEAMVEHDRKSGVDAAHARRAAEAARAAAERMEKADAAIGEDDRVGSDWFDALNDVAGLRPDPR